MAAKPGGAGKRVKSTVDDVVRFVRQEIREGRLTPGDRLVQEDLSERLSVSRGPVREAFRRLASDGLVELKFNSGASVRVFTRDEVLALEEAREAIEGAAARLAAVRFARSDRQAEFEALNEALSHAANEGAERTFLKLNESFHDVILAIGGNPVLRAFSAQLHTQAIQHQFRAYAEEDWMPKADAEHREIAEAIRAGDPDAAEAAMRRHLRRVRSITEGLSSAYFEEPNANRR